MHWSEHLTRYFTLGKPSVVHFFVNPDTDNPSLVTIASRITGIYAALKTRYTDDGHDPLADETPEDLLQLVDHLHRVKNNVTAQEDRVIDALRVNGISARRIAVRMEVDHKTVLNRFARIDRARELGLNTAGLDEHETAEDSDESSTTKVVHIMSKTTRTKPKDENR